MRAHSAFQGGDMARSSGTLGLMGGPQRVPAKLAQQAGERRREEDHERPQDGEA